GKVRRTPRQGPLRAFWLLLYALLLPRGAAAQSETRASESSGDDRPIRIYGGPGLHVSQSLVSFPRQTSIGNFAYVRSYPGPGMSLFFDLELQAKHFLVGAELQLGSFVQRTEPPLLWSLHGWAGYIIGSGEIAPYIGGGLGGLLIGQDENSKAGLAANVTAGVLFFRSRRVLRPERTLPFFLPTFDSSSSLFEGQAPAFWPVALLGVRLLF